MRFLLLIEQGANHFEEVWDRWEAMPFKGRVVWPKGIRKEMLKVRRARERTQYLRKQKIIYNNIIYQLKKDGLIEDKNQFLKLTNWGRERIKKLKNLILNNNLPIVSAYKKQSSSYLVIISYDIPEKWRGRRNWLRAVLKFLGFQMAHQSMWYGKVVLPQSFIEDLKKLELLSFVKIFSVNKSGNLKSFSVTD